MLVIRLNQFNEIRNLCWSFGRYFIFISSWVDIYLMVLEVLNKYGVFIIDPIILVVRYYAMVYLLLDLNKI